MRRSFVSAVVAMTLSGCAVMYGFEDGRPLGDEDAGTSGESTVDRSSEMDGAPATDAATDEDAGAVVEADGSVDSDAAMLGDAAHDAVEGGAILDAAHDTGHDACVPAAEKCTNGVDDDCDGLADCADPDCGAGGYKCVGVPAGWQGPVELFEGAIVPSCEAAYGNGAVDGHTGGLSFGPATCSACACTPPSGATCSVALNGFLNGGCSLPAGSLSLGGGACSDIRGLAGDRGVAAQAPTVSGGGCVATGGGVTGRSTPTWASAARACSLSPTSAAGCASGATCAPTPKAPFFGRFCVAHAGDVACPGTPYTDRHVDYAGTADTRACTACGCGAASGLSCKGSIQTFAQPGCAGSSQSFQAPTSCSSLQSGARSILYAGSAQGGACPSSGGAPTGTVTALGPTTVCCAP